MQKLKVAAAIFGCVLALAALFVPAFAVDPDYDPEQTFNTDTPLEPMQLPGEGVGLLSDPPVTTSSENVVGRVFSGFKPGFTVTYIGTSTLRVSDTDYGVIRSFLISCGCNTSSNASGFALGTTSTGVTYSGPVYGGSSRIGTSDAAVLNSLSSFEIKFSDDTYLETAQALDSSSFRVTRNEGMASALGTQIWTFGDSLISFVTSNFLVMIPIVIWLLVVAISAIKKIADPEG